MAAIAARSLLRERRGGGGRRELQRSEERFAAFGAFDLKERAVDEDAADEDGDEQGEPRGDGGVFGRERVDGGRAGEGDGEYRGENREPQPPHDLDAAREFDIFGVHKRHATIFGANFQPRRMKRS